MEKNKFTQKDIYTAIMSMTDVMTEVEGDNFIITPDDIKTFCEKQIEKLSRPRSKSDEPSKARKENEELAEIAFDFIKTAEAPMTATEISNAIEQFNGFSTSKMNAVLKILIEDGRVVKNKEKGKMIFTLA